MLPKEEFDKLNSWFSSVKNKYDTMKPIILDNVTKLGKLVGLYRKF